MRLQLALGLGLGAHRKVGGLMPETEAYIARTAGATVPCRNAQRLNSDIQLLKQRMLWDNVVLHISNDGAFDLRPTTQFITKAYDVTTKGEYDAGVYTGDATQSTELLQPTLAANGMQFTSSNLSGLDAPRFAFGSNAFTVLVWVKLGASVDQYSGMFTKGTSSTGFRAYIDRANRRMRASRHNVIGGPSTMTDPMDNTVRQLAYVYLADGNMEFWQNKTLEGTEMFTTTSVTTELLFRIGSLQDELYRLDNGIISDVMVFNTQLSGEDIEALDDHIRPRYI
jgi:hypothetical protein